jgi:hypothetical protein
MGEREGRTCHTSIQLAPYDSFSILRPARRVLTFLEDRRVLRNVSVREDVENCVQSVLKIREYLTAELSKLDSESELNQSI